MRNWIEIGVFLLVMALCIMNQMHLVMVIGLLIFPWIANFRR